MPVLGVMQGAFVGMILLAMFRVIYGPSLTDRMIGLNVVAAQVLALLVLIAVDKRLALYLDVALVYDIFGFIVLLAITRYFSGQQGAL